MVEYSGDEGSSKSYSTSTPPNSPMFQSRTVDPRSRGSRRSTLSKLVVPEDEDGDGPALASSSSVGAKEETES